MQDQWDVRTGGQSAQLLADQDGMTVTPASGEPGRHQWRHLMGVASPTSFMARVRFAGQQPLDVMFTDRDEHQAFRDFVDRRRPDLLPPAHRPRPQVGVNDPAPKVALTKTDDATPTHAQSAPVEPDPSWLVQVNGRPCKVTVGEGSVVVPGADGVDRVIPWQDLSALKPLTPYTVRVVPAGRGDLDVKFHNSAQRDAFLARVDAMRGRHAAGARTTSTAASAEHARGAAPPGSPSSPGPPTPLAPPSSPSGGAGSLLDGMTAGRALNGGSFLVSGIFALFTLVGAGGGIWLALAALSAIAYGLKILLTRTGYWWSPYAYVVPVVLVVSIFV